MMRLTRGFPHHAAIDLESSHDACRWCGTWKPKGYPCPEASCVPAGMAPCPWAAQHRSFHKGKCPACVNTGYVDELA